MRKYTCNNNKIMHSRKELPSGKNRKKFLASRNWFRAGYLSRWANWPPGRSYRSAETDDVLIRRRRNCFAVPALLRWAGRGEEPWKGPKLLSRPSSPAVGRTRWRAMRWACCNNEKIPVNKEKFRERLGYGRYIKVRSRVTLHSSKNSVLLQITTLFLPQLNF